MARAPAPPGSAPAEDRSLFYVQADCCMLCGVPESVAPELFETGEESCRLRRQPCSQAEVDGALRAMWAAEVDCVRYGGADADILRRVGEAGMADQADSPAAGGYRTIVRDHVTFAMPAGLVGPRLLAGMFAEEQRGRGRKVAPRLPGARTVWFAWYRWRFHGVRFHAPAEDGHMAATLLSAALPGLAWMLDDWLRARGAAAVAWHAGAVGNRPEDSRPTPM